MKTARGRGDLQPFTVYSYRLAVEKQKMEGNYRVLEKIRKP
jgi:hypothetical protein